MSLARRDAERSSSRQFIEISFVGAGANLQSVEFVELGHRKSRQQLTAQSVMPLWFSAYWWFYGFQFFPFFGNGT